MVERTANVLGIDVGTQSLKIGIYNEEGKKILIEQKGFETLYLANGYVEQCPSEWWEALIECLQKAQKNIDLSTIQAVTVCATSSTVLLTDENYEPIGNAMSWMDRRCIEEEEAINEADDPLVKKILTYSGEKVSVEWMITKSLWYKNHVDLCGKYILEQLDWMNYMLTGNVVASKCNASCKWNYVDSLGGFNEKYFATIGLENIQAHWPQKVVKVGNLVGGITKEVSKRVGLVAGTPVYQGGIDAHIGMVGTGSLEYGKLSLTTGTSFVHLIHSDKAVFQQGLWGPYDSPLLEQHWLLEGGQLSCGAIISWFIREHYPEIKDLTQVFKELDREIQQIPIGSENLLVIDSWLGNRSPYRNPYMSGAFIGLTPAHTKYHMYRAILEGIGFGTKNVIKTIQDANVPIKSIIVGGGLTKNLFLMQMISDITGLTLYITDDNETGTKGAAIVAAFGLGLYPSLKEASRNMVHVQTAIYPKLENTQKYEELFRLYLQLNEALIPHMKTLSSRKEGAYESIT